MVELNITGLRRLCRKLKIDYIRTSGEPYDDKETMVVKIISVDETCLEKEVELLDELFHCGDVFLSICKFIKPKDVSNVQLFKQNTKPVWNMLLLRDYKEKDIDPKKRYQYLFHIDRIRFELTRQWSYEEAKKINFDGDKNQITIFFEFINLGFSQHCDPTPNYRYGIPYYSREMWTDPSTGYFIKEMIEQEYEFMWSRCTMEEKDLLKKTYKRLSSIVPLMVTKYEQMYEEQLIKWFFNYLLTIESCDTLSVPTKLMTKHKYEGGILREIKLPF